VPPGAGPPALLALSVPGRTLDGMAVGQQTPTEPAAVFGGLERAEYEQLTRELTGYCYRMLGSPFDAEDAVQDTMMRAWRKLERFEGRSSPFCARPCGSPSWRRFSDSRRASVRC
jgi:Sigma-70 region 2